MRPVRKRKLVDEMRGEGPYRSAGPIALLVDTSTYHYKSRRAGQAGLEQRIKVICRARVRYGYRRVHVMLRRDGWRINQKKTRRVYRELSLQLRDKTPKRRVKTKLREDRCNATRPNETWAMDFVHDQLATGQKPTDNAFIEAFNSRFRAECLNAHWFLSLADARKKMEDWRKYYNEEHPHWAIGQKPPIMLLNHVGAVSPPS